MYIYVLGNMKQCLGCILLGKNNHIISNFYYVIPAILGLPGNKKITCKYFWVVNKLLYAKHLEQCLMHSKYYIRISIIILQ